MAERRIEISFGVDASELNKLEASMKKIEQFNTEINKLKKTFGGLPEGLEGVGRTSQTTAKKLGSLTQGVQNLDGALSKHRTEINSVTSAQMALEKRLDKWGKNIKVSLSDNGKFTASLTTMNDQAMKISGTFNASTNSIEKMTQTAVTASHAVDRLKKEQKELQAQAERMRGTDITARVSDPASFNVYKNSLVEYGRVLTASIDKNGKFSQSVVNIRGELVKTTGYYDKATNKIIRYNEEISQASKSQLGRTGYDTDAANRFGVMADSMKGLNKHTMSWNESMSIAAIRMVQWTASATLLFGTQHALQEMMTTIIEVDTQITELKKVMSAETDFPAMLERSTLMATEFGRKITDINEAMIEFGRMGYDESQIESMVRATTLLANVGDIASDQAASRLTGIMTVYKKDVAEAVSVVDRFNEVQNNFPVTVENLTAAVSKSGASAHAFGVTMEENIGHVTAIASATRESGNIIGNSLKTLYARATTLNPAIDALGAVGVSVFDEMTGAVRPVSDIFEELSGKWDTMTDSQRQNTAVQVAGKHHLTRFIALMENYDTALDATKTSEESWGSSMRENQTYMESLRAKINILWASLQELALSLGEAGVGAAFMIALEGATKLVQGVTGLVDTFGALSFAFPVLIGGVAAVANNFSKLSNNMDLINSGMVATNGTITRTATAMGMSSASANVLSASLTRVAASAKAVTAALLTNPLTWIAVAVAGIAGLVGHFKQLEARNETLISTTKTAKDEYQQFLGAINDGTVETYQIEKYKTQLEELGKVEETINDKIEKNYTSMQKSAAGHGIVGASVKSLTDSKSALKDQYVNETTAMKALDDQQEDIIASMGISIDKHTSLKDVLEQVNEKQGNMPATIEAAEDAMERLREQGLLPTNAAYEELAEDIDETASAMENAMGITNKHLDGLKEARGIIELLSGVENKSAAQKQLLSQAEGLWAQQLGITVEELRKRPDLMKNEIDVNVGMLEVAKRVADGTATAEEKRRVQRDLSAQNTKKNKIAEEQAERHHLKESQRMQTEESRKENERKRVFMDSNGVIKDTFRRTRDGIVLDMVEQSNKYNDTRTTFEKFKDSANENNSVIRTEFGKTATSTKTNTEKMRTEIDKTNVKTEDMALKTFDSSEQMTKAHMTIAGGAKTNLESARTQVDSTTKKYGELETAAEDIPSGIAAGIRKFKDDPMGALKELADGLVKAFKEALGIKSPSRVFMKMGKHVLDGLIKGLNVDNMKQFGKNIFKDFAGGAFDSIEMIKGFLTGDFGDMAGGFAGKIGGGVEQWRGLASKALAMTGQLTPDNLNRMLMQMSTESGGNAMAINKWDINWKNGIPSKGLMQVIDPTFRENAMPGFDKNVYDPLSNMLASIRYSLKRYGSLTRAWRGVGYADGGITGEQFSQAMNNGFVPNGGIVKKPVFVDGGKGIAGEAGAEAIIPLSGSKRGRAKELFSRVGNILGLTGYAQGGIVGVGSSYAVKAGDTLSKLAEKWRTSVHHLMKANPSIRNSSLIRVGQKLNLGSLVRTEDGGYVHTSFYKNPPKITSTVPTPKATTKPKTTAKPKSTTTSKKTTTNSAPKLTPQQIREAEQKKKMDAARSFWETENGMLDNWKALGVVGDDYYTRMFSSKKHRANAKTLGRGAINEYNKNQMDSISSFDNLQEAERYFKKADLIMTDRTKHKVWTNIKKAVTENVVNVFRDQATVEVEKFNKRFTETDEVTDQFTNTIRNFEKAQQDAFRTDRIEKFKKAMYDSVGLLNEFMPDENTTEGRVAAMKAQIEALVGSTAELQADLDPQKLNDRKNYLKSEMTRVYDQMLKIRKDMIARGVTDRETARQAQAPLWEVYYDLERQYNQLTSDIQNGTKYIDQNKNKLAEMTEEYKKLKDELKKEQAKREFTDMWGNIVRDAEGQAKMIDYQGQLIMNTYEQVRAKIDSVVGSASGGMGGALAQVQGMFERLAPNVAANVTNAAPNNTNSNNNQTNTYQADTNVTRSVTYIVQTGVALASEAELREFAIALKGMMDEEEGRGES